MTQSTQVLEQFFVKSKTPNKGKTQQLGKNLPKVKQGLNEHSQCSPKNLNTNRSIDLLDLSKSVETIYKNAVEKRISSSFEECINLSDENFDLFVDGQFEDQGQGQPAEFDKQSRHVNEQRLDQRDYMRESPQKYISAEEKAEMMIRDAEAAKTQIFPQPKGRTRGEFQFTAKMDEDYLVVGGHIDDTMQGKIIRGEYINFGKLLSRDKIVAEEDGRLELVVKNGKTYWTPVSESVVINNFSRWEQAFRIYSNIYTRAYPN